MKLYIVKDRYYGTQQEAKDAAKEAEVKFLPDTDLEEVPTDKPGLIAYLNVLMAERDRALHDATIHVMDDGASTEHFEVVMTPTVRATSADIDEIFAALPLSHRLTLAALAVEDARSAIPTMRVINAAPTDAELLADLVDDEPPEETSDDELADLI